MVFLEPPKAPAPPPEQPPPDAVVAANPPPQGFQMVTPPTDIPTEIPPVNLNEKFDPRDFTGKGVEGGIADRRRGWNRSGAGGRSLPRGRSGRDPASGSGELAQPEFPPVMQSAGIPGRVVMQFVVNTDGHVDPGSLKVMNSTHKAFEDPAQEAILKCAFKPGALTGPAGARSWCSRPSPSSIAIADQSPPGGIVPMNVDMLAPVDRGRARSPRASCSSWPSCRSCRLTVAITKLISIIRRARRPPGSSRPSSPAPSRKRTWSRPSRWPRRTRRATSPGSSARRSPR